MSNPDKARPGPLTGDPEAYYRTIRGAYDAFASDYDDIVGQAPAAARAKAVAMDAVLDAVPERGRLLDIGCGTGAEAVALARRGHQVVGIDVSEGMLDLARRRRDEKGVDPKRCRLETMRAGEVGSMADGARFDVAYSFYAVLNLEPNLDRAFEGIARVLKPGGTLVVGLLNPAVLYELTVYPLLGKLKGYRKLVRDPVRLKLGIGREEEVPCYLFTPDAFAAQAAGFFEMTACRGVHVLAPPPRGAMLKLHDALRIVNHVEDLVDDRWPLNRLGYFSLLTFEKRRDPP